MSMNETASKTLDPREIERFAAMADEWWDAGGKFKPLHIMNPVRLEYVRDQICRHHGRDRLSAQPLEGLKILDIGCGGGLLCEPLTRLGAQMTGIDPARPNIEAARIHARKSGLEIDYRAITAEELAADDDKPLFDVVLNMEVIEHVPNVPAFLELSASLLRPGGLMLASTLNRTMKSFALAIVGAEYIMRWLPPGTHQWQRFVTPDELKKCLTGAGLAEIEFTGMSYNPLSGNWSQGSDLDVNYFARALKPDPATANS